MAGPTVGRSHARVNVSSLSPDLGGKTLLVADFVLPNGLAFSPETVLYVNNTRRRHIRAFDLLPNGTLAKQTDRVFADLAGDEPGVPDGTKVDVEVAFGGGDWRRLYFTSRGHLGSVDVKAPGLPVPTPKK